MRTITAGQEAALSSRYRSVHVRVFVDRATADWIDLSDLENRDWVHSLSLSATIDNPIVSLDLRLKRRIDSLNLAPLIDGSKLNSGGTIVDLGNPIYVEIAVLAEGQQIPESTDWVEVFRGEIDSIAWEADPISIKCRDQAGVLMDRWIETQKKYPEDPYIADEAEDIMQAILDEVLGTGVVDLYSINGTAGTPFLSTDSPNWIILEYIQSKQPLLKALQTIAQQIGWLIRYKWNPNTAAFELTFYEPGREIAARGTLTLSGQPSASETFTLNATTFTAVASGATGNQFNIGATTSETCDNIVSVLLSGSESGNIADAWHYLGDKATGTLTMTGNPSDSQTWTLNGVTYTAKSTSSNPYAQEFLIFSTPLLTADTLIQAVNIYYREVLGTTDAPKLRKRVSEDGNTVYVHIEWKDAGTAGNSITFTESMSNVTANGGGYLGGTKAGTNDTVVIEWGTLGTAGNSIVFTEAMSNTTADGGGYLGGTLLGQDVTSVRTFADSQYKGIQQLNLSRADVRNVIKAYIGPNSLNRTVLSVQDTASITKYGRRYMEISEGANSQIDTVAEGYRLINSILQDLKEPIISQEVEMPFFWPVELGDAYTFEANDIHYDTDQILAVVGYRHVLADKTTRTSLTCRGKPSGGKNRWLELEARPNVNIQNDAYTNDPVAGIIVESAIASITIKYDDPRGMSPPINNWAYTKCHIDTSAEFTPSEINLVYTGRSTNITINNLTPGETYYVILIIINEFGEESSIIHYVITANMSSPFYDNTNASKASNFVQNGNFGATTMDPNFYPPDKWEVITDSGYSGTWASDLTLDTSTTEFGDQSILIDKVSATTTNKGMIQTDLIPMRLNEAIALKSGHSVTVYPIGSQGFTMGFRVYEPDGTYIGSIASSVAATAANTFFNKVYFYRFQNYGGYDPTYIRPYFRFNFISTDPDFDGNVDYIAIYKTPAVFRAYDTSGQAINSGAWTSIDFGSGAGVTADTADGWDSTNDDYTIYRSNFYDIDCNINIGTMSAGTTLSLRVYKNGSTTVDTATITCVAGNNTIRLSLRGEEFEYGDYFSLDLYHNEGTTVNIVSSSQISYASIIEQGVD